MQMSDQKVANCWVLERGLQPYMDETESSSTDFIGKWTDIQLTHCLLAIVQLQGYKIS